MIYAYWLLRVRITKLMLSQLIRLDDFDAQIKYGNQYYAIIFFLTLNT